jgi:hypothetical protein
MCMNMEHWCDDTDRETPNYWVIILRYRHFVHHKTSQALAWKLPGSLRREAFGLTAFSMEGHLNSITCKFITTNFTYTGNKYKKYGQKFIYAFMKSILSTTRIFTQLKAVNRIKGRFSVPNFIQSERKNIESRVASHLRP